MPGMPRKEDRKLLFQGADELHDIIDLGVRQFAGIGGHLGGFTLFDNGLQVGIGFALDVSSTESRNIGHFAGSVGSMAHRALRLIKVGAGVSCESNAGGTEHK